MEFRPQASFMPQVPVRGSGFVFPQKASQRYQDKQAKSNALGGTSPHAG